MIKVSTLLIFYHSFLSKFDFEGYMSFIMNIKKEVMQLLFLHVLKFDHNASQTAANINKAWCEGSPWDWRIWCFRRSFVMIRILKNKMVEMQVPLKIEFPARYLICHSRAKDISWEISHLLFQNKEISSQMSY